MKTQNSRIFLNILKVTKFLADPSPNGKLSAAPLNTDYLALFPLWNPVQIPM
jgi:hypothetical protein